MASELATRVESAIKPACGITDLIDAGYEVELTRYLQEGERVETAADPQVQAAVAALVRARQLLPAQTSR